MTPDSGSGTLSVDQAAGAFLGLMGAEDSNEQPEAIQETEEVTQELEADGEQPDESSDDDNEEQVEEKPRYKVKAAGEEIEVTLDDLIKGYQREADYTKKTQTLAEQRKQIETERAVIEQAKQQRDQYQERLSIIENALRAQVQPQENLEALKETDPIGYAVKIAEQTQREKQLQAVQLERARIAEMQQAEQSQALSAKLAQEAQRLAEVIPEYADKEKSVQVKKDIRDYAKKIGWSDEELASVYDSRAVITLYRAMQYEKLMGNKPEVNKKVNEAPKMLKAGTSRSTDVNTDQTKKAQAQLKRTGKVRDAANVFERFL